MKILKGYGILLYGNILAALGVTLATIADKGVDPLTVVYQGVAKLCNVDLGASAVIVNIILLCICLLLDRKCIRVGTIFTVVTFSYLLSAFINLLVPIIIPSNGLMEWLCLLLGIILMGVGFSTSMLAKVGPSALDLLLEVVVAKTPVSLKVCKMTIDASSVIIGGLLGGSIGLGTVVAFLLLGTVYDINIKAVKKYNIYKL